MSDFRFDPERIAQELSRPVGSLVCVPLVSPTALLGLLRIESEPLESFSADDLRFLSVIADIAALAVENAILMGHMQELSVTDGLTGLFLRRIGEERLRHELLRAEEAAHPLAFLMIDIDHFKNFNDSFGHISGDIILRRLAKWLQGFFEVPGSCVFRYGGEEFGVILPMVTKAEATRLADSWREFVKEKAMMLRREKIALTVSVGVACFPLDARRAEDLVRGADMALLVAKKGGRDRTCGR